MKKLLKKYFTWQGIYLLRKNLLWDLHDDFELHGEFVSIRRLLACRFLTFILAFEPKPPPDSFPF